MSFTDHVAPPSPFPVRRRTRCQLCLIASREATGPMVSSWLGRRLCPRARWDRVGGHRQVPTPASPCGGHGATGSNDGKISGWGPLDAVEETSSACRESWDPVRAGRGGQPEQPVGSRLLSCGGSEGAGTADPVAPTRHPSHRRWPLRQGSGGGRVGDGDHLDQMCDRRRALQHLGCDDAGRRLDHPGSLLSIYGNPTVPNGQASAGVAVSAFGPGTVTITATLGSVPCRRPSWSWAPLSLRRRRIGQPFSWAG